MTTKIIVEANHGWPVSIEGRDPNTDEAIANYSHRVEAGETRDFIVHSSMDLRIHEIQPGEAGRISAPKTIYAFELRQRVKLSESNEEGVVIGRGEYTFMPPQYLVRYRAGDGCQHECWWTEEALVAA